MSSLTIADTAPANPRSGWRLADRRLRTRLLLPVVIGCMSVVGTGVVGNLGQQALATDIEVLLTDSRVLANHLTGDMMHDALRADVLAVLLAENPQDLATNTAAIEEHAATFVQMQDENQELAANPALVSALAEARPALTAYIEQARLIADLAAIDRGRAKAGLPSFVQAFDALAVSQEQLTTQIDAHNQRTAELAREQATVGGRVLLGAGLVALLLMLGLGLSVVRSVTAPVGRVQRRLELLAGGDLSTPAVTWDRDEVGDMGRALQRAQESLGATIGAVADNATQLAAAAEEMSVTAGSIAVSAEESCAQSGVVSAAAEQVSVNIATVATGAEEMGASIREIAQNANEAAQVGSSAVSIADATNATVTRLGDSSREIGDVVKAITSIAEQTNLLALNATIEAARAGEAGKGFAVVANEVKELAQETAKATEDIGRRVQAIQADTAGAVTAIAEISSVIARMNDFQTSIASAVEEQTATTSEMSRNVSQASLGSTEIAQNIIGIATAAQATSSGVQETHRAAGELARMSAQMQTLVASFRY